MTETLMYAIMDGTGKYRKYNHFDSSKILLNSPYLFKNKSTLFSHLNGLMKKYPDDIFSIKKIIQTTKISTDDNLLHDAVLIDFVTKQLKESSSVPESLIDTVVNNSKYLLIILTSKFGGFDKNFINQFWGLFCTLNNSKLKKDLKYFGYKCGLMFSTDDLALCTNAKLLLSSGDCVVMILDKNQMVAL